MKRELIGNFLHGILHGGVISSLLDMAGGMVVMMSALREHPDCSIEELVEILENAVQWICKSAFYARDLASNLLLKPGW